MSRLSVRRTPDVIALELLDTVEERGEATKWDLIKLFNRVSGRRLR